LSALRLAFSVQERALIVRMDRDAKGTCLGLAMLDRWHRDQSNAPPSESFLVAPRPRPIHRIRQKQRTMRLPYAQFLVGCITEVQLVCSGITTIIYSDLPLIENADRPSQNAGLVVWLTRTRRKPSLRKKCKSFCRKIKFLCIWKVTVRGSHRYGLAPSSIAIPYACR
jgi:hypothetical protein